VGADGLSADLGASGPRSEKRVRDEVSNTRGCGAGGLSADLRASGPRSEKRVSAVGVSNTRGGARAARPQVAGRWPARTGASR
jgi:hypothetical protein